MTTVLGITDCVVITLMLVISAAIGVYFRFSGGHQKTTEEFLMAGKNMNVVPVSLSIMATYASAASVISIPAETYMYGTQLCMLLIGLPIGAALSAYGCVPVFYEMQVCTAYEYLEKRFGKTTRSFVAFVFAIQMILLMAVVLYVPALALNAVTGISTWVSICSLALVCIFYCMMGGLKAILWTDVFQSSLMFFAVIALIVQVLVVVGVSETSKFAFEGDRLVLFNISSDPTERYTLWNTLSHGIVYSFCFYATSQATVQRMISVGNVKKAQKALLWSIPITLLFYAFAFMDGLVLYALYHDCDPMMDPSIGLKRLDQIVPYTLLKLFGSFPGMTGLCISGIFSASLSTLSSAINALTAVTMEDFMRPLCPGKCLQEPWKTVIAKLLVVAYGALTLLLVYFVSNFRTVFEAGVILNGIGSAPTVGIFILGLFSKTANEKGAFVGLIAGVCLNSWLAFGSYANRVPVPPLSRSIEGCPVPANATFFNETLLVASQNLLPVEEKYVFPPYKMSYLWFSLIGTATVIIVGFLASALLSFCIKVPDVPSEYLSPFIRKLYYKSVTNSELEMKTKETDFKTKRNDSTSMAMAKSC